MSRMGEDFAEITAGLEVMASKKYCVVYLGDRWYIADSKMMTAGGDPRGYIFRMGHFGTPEEAIIALGTPESSLNDIVSDAAKALKDDIDNAIVERLSRSPRFPDETWNGPYRSSEMARDQMKKLRGENGLGFTFNPGGGEFMALGFRCQISTNDDVVDLEKLEAALLERSP